MPTVRLRDASEYPEPARKLFELSKTWFSHDFAQPPAMSRVMAWDPAFGGPSDVALSPAAPANASAHQAAPFASAIPSGHGRGTNRRSRSSPS